MNRYSTKRADHLEYAAWVVADSEGGLRLVRSEPTTGSGEIGIAVTFRVPLSLFRKPRLKAEVNVPEMAGINEADAIQAVVDVIEQGCAFEVDVSARES